MRRVPSRTNPRRSGRCVPSRLSLVPSGRSASRPRRRRDRAKCSDAGAVLRGALLQQLVDGLRMRRLQWSLEPRVVAVGRQNFVSRSDVLAQHDAHQRHAQRHDARVRAGERLGAIPLDVVVARARGAVVDEVPEPAWNGRPLRIGRDPETRRGGVGDGGRLERWRPDPVPASDDSHDPRRGRGVAVTRLPPPTPERTLGCQVLASWATESIQRRPALSSKLCRRRPRSSLGDRASRACSLGGLASQTAPCRELATLAPPPEWGARQNRRRLVQTPPRTPWRAAWRPPAPTGAGRS